MLEKKLEFILKRGIEDHSEIMRRMEELQDELINQQITRHKLNGLLAAKISEKN